MQKHQDTIKQHVIHVIPPPILNTQLCFALPGVQYLQSNHVPLNMICLCISV